jgi:hypothetical protein
LLLGTCMTDGSKLRGPGTAPLVRLEPGSHRSPSDGVCIVELASMIAGEPFSDSPRCVDRVIAAFLRGWNDRAGYADRQRLHPYASRVVGTGGCRRISRIRRDLCLSWTGADLDRGPLRRIAARLRMRSRIAWTVGIWPALRLKAGAGSYAARICFARGGSDEAFELLDRMLAVGSPPAILARMSGNGNGNGHRRDKLGIRAMIIARRRGNPEQVEPRSPGAPGSDSGNGAAEGSPRGRRARRRSARSGR